MDVFSLSMVTKKLTPLTLKSGVWLHLYNRSIQIKNNSLLDIITTTVPFPTNTDCIYSHG